MKKQYSVPTAEIVTITSCNILCSSPTFGEGTTPIMHAKGLSENLDDDDL